MPLLTRTLAVMVLAASASVAEAAVPELVAGAEHFCLLDLEGVRCWGRAARTRPTGGAAATIARGPCVDDPQSGACALDDARIVPPFLPAPDATRLDAADETTCYANAGKLHCFGRQARLDKLAPPWSGTSQADLFMSATHACATTPGRGVLCFGDRPRADLDRLAPPSMMGWTPTRANFTVGGGLTCAAFAGLLSCEGLYAPRYRGPLLDAPAPVLLQTRDTEVCSLRAVTGGYRLACAGPLTGSQRGGMTDVGAPIALTNPQRLLVTPSHLCVHADSGVTCVGRESPQVVQRVPSLDGASVVGATDHELCALIGGDRIECVALPSLEPATHAVPQPALFEFCLPRLDRAYERLSTYVYKAKAELLATMIRHLRKVPAPAGAVCRADADATAAASEPWARRRAFVLNALRPLIDLTQTEFLEKRVRPVMAGIPVETLETFERSPLLIESALTLLAAATTALSVHASDPADAADLRSLTALIGAELAAGASAPGALRIAAALGERRAAIDAVTATGTTSGVGVMVMGIEAWLALATP